MSPQSKRALWVPGTAGALLQLAGPGCVLLPGPQELNLLGGLLLLAAGTLLLVFALERHAAALERSDRWALCALLGPAGLYIVSTLRPAWAIPRRAPQRQTTADRAVALLLTVAVLAGFVWAGTRWLSLGTATDRGAKQMRANELLAHQRLQEIARAQHQYRQRDWDGDGQKTYARFHIHLWRGVRPDGVPVAVKLISRELAFAMAPGFALDGYYYKDIHARAVVATLQNRPAGSVTGRLDPAREWALAAIPYKPNETGVLSFIAHSSGAIWTQLPVTGDAPTKPKWVKITSKEHLQRLQAK